MNHCPYCAEPLIRKSNSCVICKKNLSSKDYIFYAKLPYTLPLFEFSTWNLSKLVSLAHKDYEFSVKALDKEFNLVSNMFFDEVFTPLFNCLISSRILNNENYKIAMKSIVSILFDWTTVLFTLGIGGYEQIPNSMISNYLIFLNIPIEERFIYWANKVLVKDSSLGDTIHEQYFNLLDVLPKCSVLLLVDGGKHKNTVKQPCIPYSQGNFLFELSQLCKTSALKSIRDNEST